MNQKYIIEKINDLCKKYDRKNYPGMAIAVIDDGNVIFKKGYGDASLDYNIPIDENTVFHACSITKQFTAACIALLIEEGKLSLHQHIKDIFPQLNECYKDITINNLLYMTNGIPDVYDRAADVGGIREDEGITRDEFWKYALSFDSLNFQPGEKWDYGNTGYFLLGQVVEAVSGMTLSQYADEHIFKPLGMKNTFIRDDHTKIIKNRAVGYSPYEYVHFNHSYRRYTTRNDEISINQENVEVGGAGQLWTTINDMILWNNNFFDNILGREKDKFIEFTTTSGLLSNGKKCGYGLGLFLGNLYGSRIIHHGGFAGGYSAYYTLMIEKKSAVIILGNCSEFFGDFYALNDKSISASVLKLLIGYKEEAEISIDVMDRKNVFSEKKVEKHDHIDLSIYEGIYICRKINVSYKIETDGDKLLIKNEDLHNDGMDLDYMYIEKDTFKCIPNRHNDNLFVNFVRNQDNEIKSFVYKHDELKNFVFVKVK